MKTNNVVLSKISTTLSRQIVVALLCFVTCACERKPEVKSGLTSAQAKAALLDYADEATRVEFTVRWHKGENSTLRLGPIVITDRDELQLLRDTLSASLDDVEPSSQPFYEVLLGTFSNIVIIKSSGQQYGEARLRLGTDVHLEFFANEQWHTKLHDASYYNALLKFAIAKSETDPTLRVPIHN